MRVLLFNFQFRYTFDVELTRTTPTPHPPPNPHPTLQVKAIECRGEQVPFGKAGDNVEVGLKSISDQDSLMVGQILCDADSPIPLVTRFKAQIITMNYKVPLLKGSTLVLFTQVCVLSIKFRCLPMVNSHCPP